MIRHRFDLTLFYAMVQRLAEEYFIEGDHDVAVLPFCGLPHRARPYKDRADDSAQICAEIQACLQGEGLKVHTRPGVLWGNRYKPGFGAHVPLLAIHRYFMVYRNDPNFRRSVVEFMAPYLQRTLDCASQVFLLGHSHGATIAVDVLRFLKEGGLLSDADASRVTLQCLAPDIGPNFEGFVDPPIHPEQVEETCSWLNGVQMDRVAWDFFSSFPAFEGDPPVDLHTHEAKWTDWVVGGHLSVWDRAHDRTVNFAKKALLKG